MSALPLTLGFRPSSHGFAWITFTSPLAVHDWGRVEVRSPKNARCLAKFEQIIDYLTPHTLVLERFEGHSRRMSERVKLLCRSVVALAHDRGIEVSLFDRNDIRACFVSIGARTRSEIAQAVARSIELLRPLLPKQRKIWQSADRRMALFEAAAVVLTHYHFGATQLFDDLLKKRDIPPQSSN